jgi:hypothetical protein
MLCIFWWNSIHKLLSQNRSFHKTYMATSEGRESNHSTVGIDRNLLPNPIIWSSSWTGMDSISRTWDLDSPGLSLTLGLWYFRHASSLDYFLTCKLKQHSSSVILQVHLQASLQTDAYFTTWIQAPYISLGAKKKETEGITSFIFYKMIGSPSITHHKKKLALTSQK